MNSKLLSILGICRRAGLLSAGYDACADAIRTKKAKILFVSVDASEKTQKNIIYEAERAGVLYRKIKFTEDEINQATGKKAKLLTVNDRGLAAKASDLWEE